MAAEDETAASVAVEPVGEGRRVWEAETQRIKAAFEIGTAAGTGMHRDPGRLVDDQDQPVAIEDPTDQRRRLTPALSPQAG